MAAPVILPDLGAGQNRMRVSSWFAEPGAEVEAGECLVEVLMSGMTFDVAAPFSGRLAKIERDVDAEVRAGDVVAWIDVADGQED